MITTLGKSVEGRPLEGYVGCGPAKATRLVLGGIHGDEPKSVSLAQRLIDLLEADASLHDAVRWVVLPVVNPDGYERRRRRNANLVDLNRNFPTDNWQRSSRRSRMYGGDQPASEPETRAVVQAITRYRPELIIAVHSISDGKHCNNYDGPGRAVANRMKRHNRYPVTRSIGYATPGSLGTWAGVERGIPTITLELPARHSTKRCWEDNRAALLLL